MSSHVGKKQKQYSVDSLMFNISSELIRDFQDVADKPIAFDELLQKCRAHDVKGMRLQADLIELDDNDPYLFKWAYQLQSTSKRYRYHNDMYSPKELEELAIQKFLDTQERLTTVDYKNLPMETLAVVKCAAAYIAHVLGDYDDEEHRSLCRFGSGATVGITARAASLAARWELPLSGSQDQITWFDSEMSQVDCVQEYWADQLANPVRKLAGQPYQVVDHLKLVLVPKTFKSLRAIMPNSTIGNYMTYGLGEMMRVRLKKAGYDIRKLQELHKYYAQQASIHSLWTTADLSSASDSITMPLVKLLFPPDWYEILCLSRIAGVVLPDGTKIQSNTFCTMGVGYTFPLQTLVFLALLKATEAVHYGIGNRRLISVYGDDMVYSSRMHDEVVMHFSRVGFVINKDKTFHEGHFRESCGGDYCRGVDVRPFQPKLGSVSVGKKTYEAILYKCINGLLMRWQEYEIRRTLRFLTSELELIAGKIRLVPCDFPDDSGVKVSLPLSLNFLLSAKVTHPKNVGHGLFRFSYLRFKSDLRKEERHGPYLWESLRGGPRYINTYNSEGHYRKILTVTQRMVFSHFLCCEEKEESLIWQESDPPKYVRSCLTGRRLRRLEPCVTVSHTGSYTRQSGTSCFEARR